MTSTDNTTAAPDKANDRYPTLATQKLIDIYALGPNRLRRTLAGLCEPDLKARPIEGKWSVQQIAIHLADSELMGATRFRQAITGSDRTFSFYHQEEWCNNFKYQEAEQAYLDDTIDLFDALRRTTASLLRHLPEDRWRCTGYHPERGNMSVRQLLENYAEHGEAHLMQIVQRRKLLGKPIALQPLLP